MKPKKSAAFMKELKEHLEAFNLQRDPALLTKPGKYHPTLKEFLEWLLNFKPRSISRKYNEQCSIARENERK